jgi:hypothetical protein
MAKAPKSSEPARRRSIICAARSGGQGKTTVAQLIHTVCQRNNIPHSLYSADFLGRDARSKLGKLYPDRVTELGIGATFEDVKTSDDMNRSIRYWDRLGDVLVEGGAVIDLGANVIDRVLDWAEQRHAAAVLAKRGAPGIDTCVVCKSTMHSVDQAVSLATTLLEGRLFPVGRVFVIINEADGKVLTEPARDKLRMLAEHPEVDVIRLPFCDSEVWRLTELNEEPLFEALEWDPDDLVERYDIDIWEATSGLAEMRAWYELFEKKAFASGLIAENGSGGAVAEDVAEDDPFSAND